MLPARAVKQKYRNKRTDGFDSKKEAARYRELLLMEKAGIVRGLKRQVRIEIIPKNDLYRAAHYVADFEYEELAAGLIGEGPFWERVIEDVKGFRTAEYLLKRKLVYSVHGIVIRER